MTDEEKTLARNLARRMLRGHSCDVDQNAHVFDRDGFIYVQAWVKIPADHETDEQGGKRCHANNS